VGRKVTLVVFAFGEATTCSGLPPTGCPRSSRATHKRWHDSCIRRGVPFRYTGGTPPCGAEPTGGARLEVPCLLWCRAYRGVGVAQRGDARAWCRAYGAWGPGHVVKSPRVTIPSPNRPAGSPRPGTPTPYAMQFFGLFVQLSSDSSPAPEEPGGAPQVPGTGGTIRPVGSIVP